MNRKTAALLFASAAITGSAMAYVYGADVTRSGDKLLAAITGTTKSETLGSPMGEKPAPQVPVAEVVTGKVAPSAEFTGHLEASRTVELRSRVGGTIESVSVPEGDLVRKGQLLFRIDRRPFEVAVATARAQLRQAEALLEQAQADLARAKVLVSNGTVSRKSFDDALAASRQRQAQIEIARAAMAAAELDLSFTQVTAPISGRIDRVLVTEGNLVSGSNAGPATLLTTIVSTDPLHVHFDIDEATFLDLQTHARPQGSGASTVKLPVQVGLMTDSGFPHSGILDFIGTRVDRSTGTIRARAIIHNPDGRLTPGLFARVKMATAEPVQAVLINDQAIGVDQSRRYVLTLDANNRVEYRPVELGQMSDGLRVISAGLKPGEKIILKGLVRPGMQVSPQMNYMLPDQFAAGGDRAAATQEVRP